MLQTFLDYLQHQRRYSDHTITAYRNDLEQFSGFLQLRYELSSLTDATRDMIRSWVVQLMEEKQASTSINRKLATLSSFYKFQQQQGELKNNPAKLVAKPKAGKKLPQFLDADATVKLFSEVEFPEGINGSQDRLILEMLFGTGMRLSELIELKLVNVNLGAKHVKVLGKRNKERQIPLTDNLVRQIKDFLELRGENQKQQLLYLFVTKSNKKLYPKFVYRLVNTYLNQVTSISKKSPHVLRHTFATHLLNKGADLNAIKELLGHSSLSATQVYTHNTIEKNKEILKRAHPRG